MSSEGYGSAFLSLALFGASLTFGMKMMGKSNSASSIAASTTTKEAPAEPNEQVHALIRERFTSCVHHIKPQLPKLPQGSQLEFYGLYKQATLGNVGEFLTHPPSSFDVVASAKYQAWKRLEGTSKSVAMQEYIDKAVHLEFTKSMLDYNDDDNADFDDDGAVIDLGGMGNKPSTLAASSGDAAANEEQRIADAAHPLHAAARDNQVATLEKLLTSGNCHPDDLDESGQTALHLAADAGHPECVKLLVKYGANVQAADNDGITVLQAAVISGDVETCRLLCVLGANPDQPDDDGDTPRACAKDDPILRDLLFRASMGQLQIDSDLQTELQELGKESAAEERMSIAAAKTEALEALNDIPIDLDDGDGDM